MPDIFISDRIAEVPAQMVFVGNNHDPNFVCERITITSRGANATFRAPRLFFDSDKTEYIRQTITVYASSGNESMGEPLFIGWIETSASQLRGETVYMTAQSPLAVLYDRNVNVRSFYNNNNGVVGTTLGTTHFFLKDNPYLDGDQPTIWQVSDILNYFYNTLDAYWKSLVVFQADNQIPPIALQQISTSRYIYDSDLQQPVLINEIKFINPFNDQIFRTQTTYGNVFEYLQQLAPGTQVFEVFTTSGAYIYLAYPTSFGYMVGTVGLPNRDWRDIGADVLDLSVETNVGETINRVIGYGDDAACTITLMSETIDAEESLDGLIPDWPIIIDSPESSMKPLVGVGAFDYDAGEYIFTTQYTQPILQVLKNTNHASPGQPDFIPGYQHVGKKWRLPNWFEFAEIERRGDIFINTKDGQSIGVQCFAVGVLDQKVQVGESAVIAHLYAWYQIPDGNFSFNMSDKTLSLGSFYKHKIIDPEDATKYLLDPATNKPKEKPARIALTFTYKHQNHKLMSDTLIDSAGILPEITSTGIATGKPYVFERTDIGYSQITNIGLSLTKRYNEIPPQFLSDVFINGGKVFQEPIETPIPKFYNKLIIAAVDPKSKRSDNNNAVIVYDEPTEQFVYEANEPPLELPIIIRDDTPKLREVTRKIYYMKSLIPRSFMCTFCNLVKYARRGMTLGLQNVNTVKGLAGDVIDTVDHDLIKGETSVRTTNQPGSDKFNSLIKEKF